MATYYTIYRYIFASRQGYTVEVNIAKKGYTGGVITRALGRAPVLRRDNNENISGTSLELYVEAATAGEYEQFYTSVADEFKVLLYRNGTLLWTGFVEPELYSEPDIPVPYDVRIIATDGLGELKRYDYELEGTHTLREHLAYMLAKTGIERDIWMSSGLNVFTTEIGYVSDALLDTVKVSLDHEIGESCYDVLQHLLSAFNMGITMYNSNWYLFRETDFLSLITDNGVRASMGLANVRSFPVVPFGSMTTNKWWPIGNMQSALIPAKKSVNLTAPYSYKENLFKDDQWAKTTGASYDEQEGAFALSAAANISQKITFSPNDYVCDRLVLKLRARNRGIGESEYPLYIQVRIYGRASSTAVNSYYLAGTIPTPSRPNVAPYAWRTTPGDMEFSLAAPAESDTNKDAQDIEVVIPLHTGLRGYAYAYEMTVTLKNTAGAYDIYLYDISLAQYDRAEGIKVAVNIENNAREKASDVDLHMADTAQLNPGEKFLMSGVPISSTGLFFAGWKTSSLTSATEYIQAMAADYAMKVGTVRRQYTGRLHVGDAQIPALFCRDGVYYFPKSYSYDLYEDEMEVDLISIPTLSYADQVAVAYGDAIGTSLYNAEIASLVRKLVNANLWDKAHAIYPMLGSSLAAKSVNLKDPQYFNLLFGENASAISNGVSFVDTKNISAKNFDVIQKPFTGYTAFVCAKQIKGTYNGAVLASSTEGANGIVMGAASNNGLQFYLGRYGQFAYVTGASTSVRKMLFHAGDNYIYNIAEGVKNNVVNTNSNTSLQVTIPNGLGYDCQRVPITAGGDSDRIFSGEVYGYALGWMSDDEATTFDKILRDFYSSVKGL